MESRVYTLRLRIADVEYTIECLHEDMEIRGNAMASGDDAADREVEDSIIEDLENGNPWAWCTVKVTASLSGFEGVDYLGGCSYKSEADFCSPDGYYPDMKDRALADLVRNIEAAGGVLDP